MASRPKVKRILLHDCLLPEIFQKRSAHHIQHTVARSLGKQVCKLVRLGCRRNDANLDRQVVHSFHRGRRRSGLGVWDPAGGELGETGGGGPICAPSFLGIGLVSSICRRTLAIGTASFIAAWALSSVRGSCCTMSPSVYDEWRLR